jgi:lipoprotein-anchoring transpeptidase ErfK/SrfK
MLRSAREIGGHAITQKLRRKPTFAIAPAQTESMLGAGFFHLNPMKNGERGIGMHGNKTGTLTPTYGCIRIKNADIEALLPYVTPGIQVTIGS